LQVGRHIFLVTALVISCYDFQSDIGVASRKGTWPDKVYFRAAGPSIPCTVHWSAYEFEMFATYIGTTWSMSFFEL